MKLGEGGGSRLAIGDLVERATAAPPKQLHGVLLDWLSERVGCDSAIFVPALDRQLRPVERNKQTFIRLHRLYEADPGRYLPGLRKSSAALGRNRMYIDTDVYSSSERRNLPFYADIIRPQRITSQLVIAIDFHGRRRGTIHLCRHGPVSRIGSSLVQRLRPIVPALGLIDAATSAAPPSPRSAAPPSAPPSRALGTREQEVAQFAARGLMTREIAALLGSSPATVRNQLHAIYRKLDVSNRTELAFVLASVQA